MLPYDNRFASIAAADRIDALRKTYAAGRVPYRWDDVPRDRDPAVRPVLAPALGEARVGCDADVSQRAA
jgi:hypothetical protein